MRWVTFVDRVLPSPQLLSEITFLRESEIIRDLLVGAMHHPHPRATNMVRSMALEEAAPPNIISVVPDCLAN